MKEEGLSRFFLVSILSGKKLGRDGARKGKRKEVWKKGVEGREITPWVSQPVDWEGLWPCLCLL